ncbi:MAG: 23S rRNA-/tRNA-specific pseudouridylate synthase [Parvicellaceae bacterium]|jgi:23S rRNA-/tRNA-specific pseudouridylate synthase
MSGTRINIFVRETGLFSRREADLAIENGRVKINKEIAKTGSIVKRNDVVELDGEVINPFKKPTPPKHVLPPAVNPKSRAKRISQREENKKNLPKKKRKK